MTDYEDMVKRFAELQARGRPSDPQVNWIGMPTCRWCGMEKFTTRRGAVVCPHCDTPHDMRVCNVCPEVLMKRG